MKTERVTLLTTPEFKAFLASEAKRERVSVAELVRARCEQRPSSDEALLRSLAAELRSAITQAKRSLREGLDEAHAALDEVRARLALRELPQAARKRAKVRA
jgi:hypothetical protein